MLAGMDPPGHVPRDGETVGPAGPPLEIVPGGPRLGERLVDAKVVERASVERALAEQRGQEGERSPLGALLVKRGVIDERTLVSALGAQLQLPVVDLRHVVPTTDALDRLPEETARRYQVVPIHAGPGDRLDLAVAAVPGPEARGALEKAAGGPVRLFLAPAGDIGRALDQAYRGLSRLERRLHVVDAPLPTPRAPVLRRAGPPPAPTAGRPGLLPDVPVDELVDALITQAVRDRASDVHVEPGDGRLRIRYRVDGTLREMMQLPATMGQVLLSRIKAMAGLEPGERRRSQHGRIRSEVEGRPLDVRLATSATVWGEKAVLRLLDRSRGPFKLGELGMPDDTARAFARLVRSPFGMVVAAGPAGSGRTATLYAALGEVDSPERNVMTVEDPVEYVVASVNQIQVDEAAGMTFTGGLRAILYQDPDVILVGDLVDVDSARLAVQAALAGHLLLTALDAPDAVSALYRFPEMGIEPFLVAGAVLGIVGQRLVRRICTACRAPYRPTAEEMAFLRHAGVTAKARFWHGEGCTFCAGSGYRDRIGVYELLVVTDEVKELLVARAPQLKVYDMARQQGMRPLWSEALRLVTEDVTTASEILRAVRVLERGSGRPPTRRGA